MTFFSNLSCISMSVKMRSTTLVLILSTFLALLNPAQSALIHLRLRPDQSESYQATPKQSEPTNLPSLGSTNGTYNFGVLWSQYIDFMEDAASKGQEKTVKDWLLHEGILQKDQPIIRLF